MLFRSPNNNYVGPDSVCVIVCDNGTPSQCDTVHIGIIVTPVNQPPSVNDTTLVTLEDSTITLCTTISDPNAGSVFGATVCGVNNGTVSASVSGNQLCITYTPNPNFSGLDTACIIVCDNGTPTQCDTVLVPIVVLPVNDPPSVTGTNGTTPENTPITLCSTITDIDTGSSFTASVCGVENGTANVTGANSFTVSSTINPQDLTHFSINGAISTGVTDAHTIPRGTGADTVVQSYVNGSNGAVYKIDLSLDGSHWINYTSVTHGSSDGNTMYNIISPGWAYLRANVTTIGANTNLVLMTSE